MSAKIITYGSGITAGSTAIPDNTSVALDIESTDGAEYVKIDTTDSNEKLILGDGLPATGAVCIGTDDNKLSSTLQQLTIGHPDGSSKVRVHVQGTSNGALMTMNCGTGAQNAEIDFRDGEGGARWVLGKQGSDKLFRIIGSTGASGSGTCITGQYETGFWSVTPDGTGPTAAHAWHVQDGDLGVVTNSNDAVAKNLVFTKSRNATDGAHTPVADNDVIGTIQFKASNGAAFSDVASIRAQIDGEPGAAASISSISAAGAGYTATGGGSASATSTTSGVGSGLTVSITVGGSGEITGASVVSAGTRYVTGETVTVTGGSSAATLVVTADTSDMPGSLRFATSADGGATLTDRFVIRQGGNVGIGDTEPNYHCVIGSGKSGPIAYVYNSNTSELSSGITAYPNGAAGMIIDHRASDSLYLMNTTKGNTADVRNTGIAFFGRTDEASDEYPMMGAIRVRHEGTAADQKGYMAFYTNDGTDDRTPTEGMRITSDGKIGINDPAPPFQLSVKASATHEDLALFRTQNDKEALRVEVYDSNSGAIRIFSADAAGDAEKNQHVIVGRSGSNGSVEFNIQQHDCDFNYSSENQANMLFIDADTDRVGIGTNAPAEALDINSDAIRIRTAQTPASGGTGTVGMICWDANYMYVCTATDTWKRVALTGGY